MKRVVLFVVLAACTDTRKPITGTQSIEVELVMPASPGDVDNRLPDTQRTIVINLRAKDAENQLDATFSATLRVYAQFLGTLSPPLDSQPLATIAMTSGVAMNQTITLPDAYGPTTLWIDNGDGVGAGYVFGTVAGNSPTLWFRDPFVSDLQRPRDESALDALSTGPLQDKQIRVGASRYGNRGVLVVTSTFAQGYTVADVQCATGLPNPTPPCTAGDYDHAMVFTFSAPRDQFGHSIVEGELISAFNGGLSEFNDLTEVGFPRTFTAATSYEQAPCTGYPDCSKALEPTPVLFSTTWFQPLLTGGVLNPQGRINFERNEAGPIEIRTAKVCPIEEGPTGVYTRFKQWKIDPSAAGDQCGTGNVINLVTAGTDFTTDPHTLVGKTLAKVVGFVRPAFTNWIVYPRGKDDIVLQ